MNLVRVLKAVADETRLRIVLLLAKGELCVCELEHLLGTTQSNVSKHLEKLLSAGIVEQSKKAQWVYYRLSDEVKKEFPFISGLIETGCCSTACCGDIKKLEQYRKSGVSCTEIRKQKQKEIL